MKALFFCDILGTYLKNIDIVNGQYKDENREILVKNFVETLNLLACIDGVDTLEVCFISTNHPKDIILCIKELEKHTKGTKVKIGECFSESQKIVNGEIYENHNYGKALQIQKCMSSNPEIVKTYYADDTPMYHHLLRTFVEKHPINCELVGFVPGIKKDNSFINMLKRHPDMYLSEEENIFAVTNLILEYIQHKYQNNDEIKPSTDQTF